MRSKTEVGIIICHRYITCSGGKCLRALKNKEGAFSIYKAKDIELVGYATCGGCPGGNIEYAPQEMVKNGVEVIHLATGLIVGYPACPYIEYFKNFIETRFDLKVIYGTHPIPQNYYINHMKLKSWNKDLFKTITKPILSDEKTRLSYD